MAAKSVLPIASIPQAFSAVARLTDAESDGLKALTETGRSFWPLDQQIKDYCSKSTLSKEDVESILSILRFVYDRLGELDGEDRSSAVKVVVEENLEEDIDNDSLKIIVDRLNSLLLLSEKHGKFQKLYRLERGFLPIAAQFETLVDLRPDFDADATEIVGFIPIVSMRIRTTSSDPALRNFSFTIPLEKIAALTKSVERMNAKLSILSTRLANDPPVKK